MADARVLRSACAQPPPDWDPSSSGYYANSPWSPASILNGNPCTEEGDFYPIKPYSYFCPVACGCRAGDKHCPQSCPLRTVNETRDRPWGETFGIDATS